MKLENCYNSYDNKHEIGNNTAMMNRNGTCGLCVRCTCIFTPKECYAYYLAGHKIDENLIKTLTRLGFMTNKYWYCQSCLDAISNDIDRVCHFKDIHNFKIRTSV